MNIPQPLGTILLTLVGGIFCLILSRKTKIPSILYLLVFGIVFGPESLNVIQPQMLDTFFAPTISLLIALVLFEGGASLKLDQFREVSNVLKRLLTTGVITTLVVTALAAFFLADVSIRKSILLGSIMVVTGPTVILPILRRIRVKPHLHNILKWEAILVDPLGVVLSVFLFELLLVSHVGFSESLLAFGVRLVMGVILGFVAGWVMHVGLTKEWFLKFESEELGGLFILAMNLLFYGIAEIILPDSGLVVATVAGVYLGNKKFAHKEQVFHFKIQLTLFALSIVFILISSRIPISTLSIYFEKGLKVLAVMIFLGRPLSIFISTIREKGMPISEKVFLSSLAPRGIVSASLATLFALHETETASAADPFLPLSFIIILGTILFYAVVSPLMARLPGVQEPPSKGIVIVGANPFSIFFAKEMRRLDIPIVFIDTNPQGCSRARRNQFEAYVGSGTDVEFLEALDLKGIGAMVALTGNHELNVLCCQTFARILGQENVYRLWDKSDSWEEALSEQAEPSWGKPLALTLSDNYITAWELAIQGANPLDKSSRLGTFMQKLRGNKKWKVEVKHIKNPIKVVPENLEEEGLYFPLYGKKGENYYFLTPGRELPKEIDVITLEYVK